MNVILKFWTNFKSQPDIWFFYGFLLTFTLTIRKVLFFYPINGQFNEYAGIYLYLSDLFLMLVFLFFLYFILRNKKHTLSICSSLAKSVIFLPLLLVAWSFISIAWSANQNIALFRSIKLLELYLLYIYIAFRIAPLAIQMLFHPSSISNVPCGTLDNYGASVEHILWGGTIIKNIFKIIIFLGLFQAIIGILQFILQHSVGLFWLKESLILLNIDGVAKIIFNGQKYIRAYGLFPHPNILGGFLLLSIIFTIYYKKMFHPSSISNVPPQNNCSMWNSLRGRHGTFKNYGAGTKQYKTLDFLILVQLLAIILTFSKSAILALIIALLYIFVPRLPREIINANVKNTDVPRETLNSNISDNLVFHWGGTIPFHKSILKRYWIPGFLVILSLFLIVRNIYPEMSSNIAKSINERSLYLNVSRGTITQNPILGLGMGQFVINMQKYAIIKLENWQFQPVHNVFLLVWSELGIIGLILFMLMLWKLFHYVKFNFVPHETKLNHVTGTEQFRLIAKGILLGFIFIMIFDHYFWDIQQGQIMLWMIMAFTTGVKKID